MKRTDIDKVFARVKHNVLTTRDIAAAIRCSDEHVCNLIRDYEIPCFLVGTRYRVLKEDIIAHFKNQQL